MAAAVIQADFTEIDGAALRGDGPQHIGQVLEAELRSFLEILDLGVDLGAIAFIFNSSFTRSSLQQFRALKIDLCCATGATEINGFCGAGDGGSRRALGLAKSRRSRQSQSADQGKPKRCHFHVRPPLSLKASLS